MPGFELIGLEEKQYLNEIFETSNGVLFPHGFDNLRNGRFRVREFEKSFSEKINIKFSQTVTSGTVAQMVAMLAMGIKPGDEIITQSFTFVATIESILSIGAIPVIVNIDETYNIDPIELENAISPKTKLIVPVHMLGNPASMDKITKIGEKYNIPILEDACEALGAKFNNKYVGTIGDAGIFSLDFAKTITTGEGGIIVTNNEKYFKFSKEYQDHGHENNPNYPRGRDTRTFPGMNFRMNEMQGAVGLAQLKKLDYILEKNRLNKSFLKNNLNSEKINFRKITDIKGDLSDTLIFNFETTKHANKFVKLFNQSGYFTKNIPDALDWHFSGTWNHMFKNVKAYKNNWSTKWEKSSNLLFRSVAIPIFVNSKDEYLEKQLNIINKILIQL